MIVHVDQQAVPIGVGLDTARYGHHVSFLRQDLQRATTPFYFPESQEGYAKLREAFDKVVTRHGQVHFHIRVDAAGQYAANLLRFLHGLPYTTTISVGEPKRNKDYRNVHFPKRKADAVESVACARFAIVERPNATPIVPPKFVQLREVLSALQSQTKRTTRLINQLHNRLSRAFPELATLVNNLAATSVLFLLQKYPTAEKIAAARRSSLQAIRYLKPTTAETVHKAAKQSTASLGGPLIEEVIRQLVAEILLSQKSEKNLEKLLQKAFDALPAGNHVHVESILGIGKLTAAALVANMVSIDHFETPDSVVNYYGVFPEENTSGVDRSGKAIPPGTMRMCQKGNDLIRKLLYMSSLSAIQNNPAIRALYARQMAKHKRGDVALGHCMRKLLHLVFAVWKTGKPFNPNHYPWAKAQPSDDTSTRLETAPQATEETAGMKEQNVAGRKGQSPKRKAVTATPTNVEQSLTSFKKTHPVATHDKPNATPFVDFATLKQQVPIKQALSHLGHLASLRGSQSQRRGPCPIHGSQKPTSRSFSVNFEKNAFQCFAPNCAAQGDVINFWAAIHNLPPHEAACHLAQTFGIEIKNGTEEKRNP